MNGVEAVTSGLAAVVALPRLPALARTRANLRVTTSRLGGGTSF
jgi:hypothetical protein